VRPNVGDLGRGEVRKEGSGSPLKVALQMRRGGGSGKTIKVLFRIYLSQCTHDQPEDTEERSRSVVVVDVVAVSRRLPQSGSIDGHSL